MLQEFILGKSAFFFFFSFLSALGNVIQQECSQEPLVAEGRLGSSSSLGPPLPHAHGSTEPGSGAETQGGRNCSWGSPRCKHFGFRVLLAALLPAPALDRVTRRAGSPSPVACHHLSLTLIVSQSNLRFPNIKAPRSDAGGGRASPHC